MTGKEPIAGSSGVNTNPVTPHNLPNPPNPLPQSEARVEVSRVTVKAPPFWKANPALWFCQLEAQFQMNQITSDRTKYYTVVAAIESTILDQVSDLVLNPPSVDLYLNLKRRLLDVFAVSEQSRLKKLLGEMEIADQKPSFLLREMRSLAGTSINADMLKTLWLQRLPHNIQAILSVSSEDVDRLVVMADKIYETSTGPEINKINTRSSDKSLESQIAQLTVQVSELRSQMANKSFSHSARSRSSSRSGANKRSQTPSRSNSSSSDPKICWYHKKFGDKAKACIGICNYKSNSKN